VQLSNLIDDYQGFFLLQRARLGDLDIDISERAISHLAYRTKTLDEYVKKRDAIEQYCLANVENVWNGRPISKLLLKAPLDFGGQFSTRLIELIPPSHRDNYKMGLEHVGIVMGDDVDVFYAENREKLSGQQIQSEACEPYFIRFDEDKTMVKFYRNSLQRVCEIEGHKFDDFYHSDQA